MTSSGIENTTFRLVAVPIFYIFRFPLSSRPRSWSALTKFFKLRGATGKSLTRPTSRCRGKESIVSLERGACSCAELPVFSCYRGCRKHVRRPRDFNNIETRAIIKDFFFLQGKAPKEIHAILTETLG